MSKDEVEEMISKVTEDRNNLVKVTEDRNNLEIKSYRRQEQS